VEGTTEMLLKTINLANQGDEADVEWLMFDRRTYAGHRMDFDEFLNMYRLALKSVAEEKHPKISQYLDKLDPHKHEVLMHLHLETIQVKPSLLANRLVRLVSDQLVFKAGWNGAQWYSFAHAFKRSAPYLAEEDKEYIEKEILQYRPELDTCINALKLINDDGRKTVWTKERVILQLRSSGFAQWCILETMGKEFLTLRETKSRLAELRRKFSGEEIAEPNNMVASFVPSPIDGEKCEKMDDGDWLLAIEYYDNDPEKRRKRDFMSGGARQLAGQLQHEVKKAPERFAKLGLKIPYSAPTTYFTHLLWGLAEKEDLSEDSIIKLIKYADKHPEKPFSKEIAHLIEKHPHLASNDEVLNILISYALNGIFNKNLTRNITDIENEEITIDKLTQKSKNDYVMGMNSVRGRAWEALGSILWEIPNVEDDVWEAIEVALEKEPEIYVRCCILQPLIPLFNLDKEKFSKAIRKLIEVPNGTEDISKLTPLMTNRGIYIFGFMFYLLPELADELVNKFLDSEDENIELIGSWLIYRESFRNEEYISIADKFASKSLKHERLLASLTSKAIKWAENRDRVKSLLESFFYHDDSTVRQFAAKTFRNVPEDEIEKFVDLAETFVKSPAFDDHSSSVLSMIEKANCEVLEIVVQATERLIEKPDSENTPYGKRTTDLHQVQKLLKHEYSSSQKNFEVRVRILDLIDNMLRNELYGVDRIVEAHDRW
jgi:hypothetical protein